MTEIARLVKELHPLVLVAGGIVGLLAFLTGLAMIYEPLWLIAGGALLVAVTVALAYEKGSG